MASSSPFKLPGTLTKLSTIGIASVFISMLLTMTVVEVTAAFGQNCTTTAECVGATEECDGSQCVCKTAEGFLQFGDSCRLPKYNETCSSVCEGSSCVGDSTKTCVCTAAQYYDATAGICENKKAFSASCNLGIPNQCKKNLTCIDEKCGCTQASHYYDLQDTFDCQPRKDEGDDCFDIPNECKDTLTCQGGTCLCSGNEFYNGSSCQTKGDRGDGCTGNTQCQNDLSCISKQCDCDSVTQYYSGGTCLPKKTQGFPCSSDDECDSAVLSCYNGNCDCDGTRYWSGSTCMPKKTQGATCSSDDECQSTVLLSCDNGKCDCDGTRYWSGSTCVMKQTQGATCSSDDECQSTVLLSCYNGNCDCDGTRYWSGTTCLLKQTKGATCSSDDECQSTVLLSCYNGNCNCDGTRYWSGSTCVPKKTQGATCSLDNECDSAVLLSCYNGNCDCDGTHYWSGTTCAPRKDHAEPCNDDKECLGTPEIKCMDRNGVKKCLCGSDYYYPSGGSGSCTAVAGLGVQVAIPTRGVDNIQVTWSVQTQDASVLYKVYNSPPEGSQTSITNGMDLTGLTPGTEYLITIESYIPSNDNYDKKKTLVAISAWTMPAKPGLFDKDLSQLNNSLMVFGFTNAIGNFKEYRVTILTTGGIVVTSKTVSENQVTGLTTLAAAETYAYQIITVNGNQDQSGMSQGTFTTGAATSSQVEGFSIKDKTATSVGLEWKPPSSPNGEIQFFFAQLVKDGSCIEAYYFGCSDCGSPQVPDYGCATQTFQGSFTKAKAKDASHVFNVDVTTLQSYTTYTVKVFAVNQAGDGNTVEETFKTDESAAEDLVGPLVVSGFREDSDRTVGVVVGWTPGRETGQTNYTVTLTDMVSSSVVETRVVVGYGNTNTKFPELLAFHDYSVDVFAETKIGRGTTRSMSQQTPTAVPGAVGTLQVLPDNEYARRMRLQFSCPSEQEWNGVIQKFIITKTDNSGGLTNYDETDFDCSSPVTVSNSVLGRFDIKETYTFQVVTRNQDFSSVPSNTATFYVVPKEPVFERSVVSEKSDAEATKDTITVSLCSSCMTNDAQGSITHAGLIVCVKSKTNTCQSSRRKRATMTVAEFQRYGSWAQAESDDFNSPYRTTPDTWLTTLITGNPTSYVIGDNPECDDEPTQPTYCNGPLPSGKEIVVTAVSCTEAGCLAQAASGFVLKTRAVSASSDDSTGIIVGVVVTVVVVAAVVAAAFVYLRIRRKKKEDPPHLPFKDLSDPHRKPIKIRDFKDQVAMLHKDSNLMFQGEFEDIKSISADFKYTNEEAQRECNRVKNRYVDILPYDHSRVKLETSSENEDGSDFINASYIPGLNSKREYIASQGPMHATVPHFWTMVWEQKTKVIVMLSDLMENSRMKVHLYWPENLNEPISYGDVVVEMTNFSQLNKYIIRNFKITNGNQDRRVTHFFIPGWWDFSANLTFDDVLEFAQLVRKEITPPDSGPLVVHCSAGVGRTGTFIALDYFMQYIERRSLEDNIDVFEYVLEMRKNRPRMVQAETQYIFIFDALVEVIDRKIKAEQERLYDNMKPVENVYANHGVTEDPVYANASVVTAKDSAIVDFSYSNQAFEPDSLGTDFSSSSKPTTVL